ncbi:MAG: hypothetical protein HRT68_16065 [Flavobacteriaceae bacterium]|nr:hypothetical protein [Flavobacteriaceae bacterium]
MSKTVALHPDVHNALIINSMDNFTVSEVRDVLMHRSEYFNNESKAREYIYRVIFKFARLGLLIKHPHSQVKKIKYTKSELFFSTHFVIKKDVRTREIKTSKITLLGDNSIDMNTTLFSELLKKKQKHEAELAIKLGEVEEFKSLMKCYPHKNELFNRFYLETKDCSAQLLGKVNALTKVLSTSKMVG